MNAHHDTHAEFFHREFSIQHGNLMLHGLHAFADRAISHSRETHRAGMIEATAGPVFMAGMFVNVARSVYVHCHADMDAEPDAPITADTKAVAKSMQDQAEALIELFEQLTARPDYHRHNQNPSYWYADNLTPTFMLAGVQAVQAKLDATPPTDLDRIEAAAQVISTLAQIANQQAHCDDPRAAFLTPDGRREQRRSIIHKAHLHRATIAATRKAARERLNLPV